MTHIQDATAEVGNALMRQFLLALAQHEIEAKEAMGRKNPIWTEKHNFQSLLNVPNHGRMLGPIQNRWEGGLCGEGHLRCVKPITKKGRPN